MHALFTNGLSQGGQTLFFLLMDPNAKKSPWHHSYKINTNQNEIISQTYSIIFSTKFR